MPATYRILPDLGLVYIRHTGTMTIEDSAALMDGLFADPEFTRGMNELVDFSDVTGWSRDFAALMQHQAREVEMFNDPLHPSLVVCLAPTPETQSFVQLAGRAWDGSDRLVLRCVATEQEALTVLDLHGTSIARLLQSV